MYNYSSIPQVIYMDAFLYAGPIITIWFFFLSPTITNEIEYTRVYKTMHYRYYYTCTCSGRV